MFSSLCITLASEYRQLETTKLLHEELQVSYLLKLMRSASVICFLLVSAMRRKQS